MKILLVSMAMALAGATQAATVHVTLTGVQPRGGQVMVALQTREQFMQRATTAHDQLSGDRTGEVHFDLADVAPGDYALSVLHDQDGNRRMTMAADGRPAEGWTMTNAARLRGKPSFDQVSFHVPAGSTALVLPMIYPAKP